MSLVPTRRIVFLLVLLSVFSGGAAWLLDRAMEGGRAFPFASGDRLEAWTVGEDEDVAFEKIQAGGGDFKPAGPDGRLVAPRGSVLWVRLTLNNDGDEARPGILRQNNSRSDEVGIYYRAGAAWKEWHAGESVRAGAAPAGVGRGFFLTIPAHSAETLYLRVRDRFGPVCDLRWHEPAGYMRRQGIAAACDGVYFGLLAGLLFYNLILYLRARQTDLIWYCAYLLTVGGWLLVATNRTLSLHWPLGSPLREQLLVALLFATAGFIARLARTSLELARLEPAWDRRLGWTEAAAAAAVVLVFGTGRWFTVEHVFSLGLSGGYLLGAAVLAAAWRVWRKGVRTGAYFVLAQTSLFVAVGQGIFIEMAGFGASDWRNLTVEIGSVVEMLIFGIAMAERVRRMHEEREQAQARALAEAGKREVLQAGFAGALAREVEARTADIMRLSAEKDRMMQLLGHDLRSPLAALDAGLLEILRDHAGGPDAPALERLRRQARVLATLVRDVLARADADQPSPVLPVVSFAVAEFLEEIVSLYRGRIEQKRQTIIVNAVEAGTVELAGSAGLLRQALMNLVDNAVKFTPEGGVIRVGARVESERLFIEVADEGPGLTAEDFAGLFKTNRALSARPTGGESSTGLGLVFVNEIVHRHGGQMLIDSIPGRGAVFGFTLPVIVGGGK